MTDKKFPANEIFNTELFLKNGEIIDPDDVGVALNAAPHPVAMTETERRKLPWYGGNKIPDSYLKKFQKSVEDEGIPYDLRVFLDKLK